MTKKQLTRAFRKLKNKVGDNTFTLRRNHAGFIMAFTKLYKLLREARI